MGGVDLLQLIIFLAVALLAFLGVVAGFLRSGTRRGRRGLDARRDGTDLLAGPRTDEERDAGPERTGSTALDERPSVLVEPGPVEPAPTVERPEGIASRL